MVNRVSRGFIATIIGPVGVGKSTQIRKLENYFRSRGQRVVVTFIKTNHILSYAMRQFLMTLDLKEKICYPGGITRIFLRREIVKKLFRLLLVLDVVSISVKFLFTVYLPYHFGYAVLVEEGPAMSVQTYLMSYPYFYGTKPKVLPFLPRLLNWIANKNNLTIVIDADDKELERRRKSRPYRKDEVPEFVSLQRKGTSQLASGSAMFVDTTNESAQNVHGKIVKAIEETISRRTIVASLQSPLLVKT